MPDSSTRNLTNPAGRAPAGTVAAAPGLGSESYFAFEDFPLSDDTAARINIANGNLLITSNDGSTAAPGVGISLDRYYNGLTTKAGSFGGGWTSEFSLLDVGLTIAAGVATFHDAAGTERTFTETTAGSGTWTASPGVNLTLQTSPNAAATAGKDSYWITDNKSGKKWVFTQAGWLYQVLDRNGIGYTYSLDASATPSGTATDVNGRATTFVGNASPATATDSAGRVVKYTKDSLGRLVKVEKPGGTTSVMTYDTVGRLATIAVAGSSVSSTSVTFTYDSSHRIATVKQKSSSTLWGAKPDLVTTFAYPAGKTTIKDANNNTTTFSKNTDGLITAVQDSLSRTRTQTWTPGKSVASTTDALGGSPGNQTLYTYDVLNNPTQSTLPTGAAASAVYAQGTNCPDGSTGTAYQVKCSFDAAGNSRGFQYDAAGNQTKLSDTTAGTNTAIQEFVYEVPGRTICGGYAGQKCSAKDANGNVTTYQYNATGDLVTVTPPAPLGATTYTYDALSRVKTVTNGNAQTTSYTYDARDRILTTTFQSGSSVSVTYWPNGLKKSETSSKNTEHLTKLFEYDEQGNLTKQTGPENASVILKMEYDAVGNLRKFEDSAGQVGYSYNAANELVSIAEPGGTCASGAPASGSGCIKFSYDANGNEIKRTFPGNATVSTTRDASGRPTSIVAKNGAGLVSRSIGYTYSLDGADTAQIQTRVSTNEQGITSGAITSYTYDTRNRLTKAEEKAAGSITAQWRYAFDAMGNRTSQSRFGTTGQSAGTISYTYNAANQLISETGKTDRKYKAGGEDLSPFPAGWDDRGGADVLFGGETVHFGQGNTELMQLMQTQFFTNSPLGIAQQQTRNFSGTATTVIAYTRTPAGELASNRINGAGHYYILDGLGSVVGTFSSNGGFEGGLSYSPYGEDRSVNTATPTGGMKYIGQLQARTAIYKFGARYYDVRVGRFLQMDPSGQEAHPYAYAGCNPIGQKDPTGLDVSGDCWAQAGEVLFSTAGAVVGSTTPIGALFTVPTYYSYMQSIPTDEYGYAIC
ncbi:RHS repeat-associated core domain-containing protein [Plantibacter sp. VKM Ac-2885]|uniref:RHS repeat-associated core domain-containing protein n=1 Tax=Plantibacter sp. VKM Ac-2885 TaxID=2783828 RepID=UPI00188B57C8|nr:RHS repeat-associated core domain-containing protein [Plantibacter sp. VKM Ac-2885]